MKKIKSYPKKSSIQISNEILIEKQNTKDPSKRQLAFFKLKNLYKQYNLAVEKEYIDTKHVQLKLFK